MLKLFALMLMSFILVSCGGGKSTATLSISRGMLFANTTFSGGIYISGLKADGSESFLATITSGNSTNVSISQGTWNFKVIAWDGGGVMQGTPYCKFVNSFEHTTEGAQLDITTTNAECFMTNIASSSQLQTANSYKALALNTCGAMYNSTDTSLLSILPSFNPCGSYPAEFRKTHGYFKLHLFNQTPAGIRTAVAASTCLTAQSNNPVQFPNRVPVTVKFYKDSGCTQEVDEYIFKRGFDFNLSSIRTLNDFDWQVTSDSAYYFVTIASGASKRGTTAFHTETPIFKCMEGGSPVPCTKLPTATAATYYLDPNTYAVIKIPNLSCVAPTFTGLTATYHSCHNFNGSAYVGLTVNNTSPVNGTMNFNGSSFSLKVGNTTAGLSSDRVRDAYKTMKRTLGVRNSSDLDNSLQDDFDEDDDLNLGLLSSAIFELSPMGAGGTFFDYFSQCSTAPLSQIPRSYVKKGVTYTVALSGITGMSPGFTSRADEPEFMTPELHYNRRIVVRKFVGPSYTTEKVIDFSCDSFDTAIPDYVTNSAQVRNGKLEEQKTYLVNDNTVTLKKIIFWNTSSSDTGRFDVYRSKSYVNSSSTIQKLERNFYRVTKSFTDSYNHFKVHGMNYLAVRDGSSYDESVIVNEVDGKDNSGVMNYSHKRALDIKAENGTIGNIFDNIYARELDQIRYGYHQPADEVEQSKVSSAGSNFVQARRVGSNFEIRYAYSGLINDQSEAFTPDNIATDISDDGTKMIVATNNMSTIHYYYIDNGVVSTSGTFSATSDPSDIKVGVLNDGTWVVGYIESGTDLLTWNKNGTSFSSPYGTYVHKSLDIVKTTSEIYLNFIRGTGSMQYLELCKSNGACNGYASRVSASPFTYSSIYNVSGNFVATYIHNSILNTLEVSSSTLFGGTQIQPTQVRYFSPYLNTNYTDLNSSTVLRSSAGTLVETSYPFYNPTLLNFQMKPRYLKQAIFESHFTSGFSNLTN